MRQHQNHTPNQRLNLLPSTFSCRPDEFSGLDENTQFENIFFPHYIVIGEEFIRSNEAVISAVHYHFENLAGLLVGNKTFTTLHPTRSQALSVLKDENKRSKQLAVEHGWENDPFEPEISDHPELLYFSGLWEIISTEATVGKISLTNRTSHEMGTASGIGIQNEVTANIAFAEPKTLSATVEALYTLHSLFELSLGHRQRYGWIELEFGSCDKDSEIHANQTALLYCSMCNERVSGNSKAHLTDILLAPDRRPEEFLRVVKGWMDSTQTMRDPRGRFATAFFGDYGINRIVGAANMFDLLPETFAPKRIEPDSELLEAKNQCQKIFQSLPDTAARQSVLSALGRVGMASLRDKVHYRAKKIMAIAPEKFSALCLPCNHAVLARNHYVHGSPASFDYQKHFTEFAFLTDTLEFVFAASDLLDLGWNLDDWLNCQHSQTHGFSAYLVNYAENMRRLKVLVEK